MYILELCAKIFLKSTKKKKPVEDSVEYEKCDHLFQAMDSEKKYLACSKCGFVIENPEK